MSHDNPDPNNISEMLHAYYYDSGRDSREFSILMSYGNNDAIDLALIPQFEGETIRICGQGIEFVLEDLARELARRLRDAKPKKEGRRDRRIKGIPPSDGSVD